MSETEPNYNLVSYVISSQYRKAVIQSLTDGPATPSELEDKLGIEIAHVSRALTEMREKDMVDLLVAEETNKGRIYGLTDEGSRVADHVAERDG